MIVPDWGVDVRPCRHHSYRMTPEDEARAIDDVTRRLATNYPHLDVRAIAAEVETAHGQFAGSRIRDFIPLFVERAVRDRLAAQPAQP